MSEVFVDTQYWVATVDPGDPWRLAARTASESVGSAVLVTTEEVLAETLGFLCKKGPHVRQLASQLVRAILASPTIVLLHQTHESFLRGLNLYERRADKGYSLVDCISMVSMRERDISDVLSGDQHFRQEGFVPLIDPDAS